MGDRGTRGTGEGSGKKGDGVLGEGDRWGTGG